jgi:hypothetical protein
VSTATHLGESIVDARFRPRALRLVLPRWIRLAGGSIVSTTRGNTPALRRSRRISSAAHALSRSFDHREGLSMLRRFVAASARFRMLPEGIQ